MSPLGARLALAGVSALATLIAAEVAVRGYAGLHPEPTLQEAMARSDIPSDCWVRALRADPRERIGYGMRPGFDGAVEMGERRYPLSTNRHGFRGSEWSVEKPPRTVRIVGIGDSVMMGHGVAPEETYLARLEDALRRAHPGTGFEVLNLAVAGYNTTQEVATLREVGLAFSPDLVLLNVVENDQNGIMYRTAPVDPWTLRRSFLFDSLASGGVLAQETRHGGWNAARDAMCELSALSKQHGFEVLAFAVVGSPTTYRLLEIASGCGLRTRDCGEALSYHMQKTGITDYYTSELVLSRNDAHPSARHHRVIAEDLAAEMERQGLTQFCRDRVQGSWSGAR